MRYRQQKKLIEGIHWGRNPSGKILYNPILLNQLISCNGDINHPEHLSFIQRYQMELPQNQHLKPGSKPGKNQAIVVS